MTTINEFLNDAGVFFMATVDGDQPRLRPLGAHFNADGREIFGVGDFKNVYRQMKANPKVEIVACKGGDWLRFTGTAVFESDPGYAEKMLDLIPSLRDIYNEQTGNKMMCFHLEDSTAVVIHMMGEGDPISE